MAKTQQRLETEDWKVASATADAHLKRALDIYQ